MDDVSAAVRHESMLRAELWGDSGAVRLTLLVCIMVAVVSFISWVFAVYPDYLHSDSAAYLLLAEDIIDSGQWFSPSWHYVSDGVSVFDGAQVAVPFVWLWGVVPLALSCAALVSGVALVGAVYFLGQMLGIKKYSALCAGVLCLSGPSMIYLDLMFGYTIAVVVAQHVILIAVLAKIAGRDFNWLHVVVAVTMVFLLFAANPKKAFAFSLLPSAFAGFTCLTLAKIKMDISGSIARRRDVVMRLLLAAAIVGFSVHQILVGNLQVNTSYAQVDIGFGWQRIRDNGLVLYQLALEFLGFGGQVEGWVGLVGTLFRCLVMILIGASFVNVTCKAWRSRQWAWIFMSAFVVWGGAVIASALLLGAPIKQYYGVYYFVYAMCPLPLFTVRWLVGLDWSVRRIMICAVIMPALCLSVSVMVAKSFLSAGAIYKGPGVAQKTTNAEKRELISWLGGQGVSYGYAPFWDANAMTVLSEGAVRVVPQGALFLRERKAMRWLISDRYIRSVNNASRIFVAVHDTPKDLSRLSRCYGSQRPVRVGSYQVVVVSDELTDCISEPVAITVFSAPAR